MSGVGKSHIARWIGYNAAYISGLDVLHIQLEGAASETTDAYSAMLSGTTTYEYESGKVNNHTLEHLKSMLDTYKGTLRVKAYPKFGKEVSTTDIRTDCDKYREKYGKYPDVIIVDSLDLCTDSSGKNWDSKSLRHKRIATAQDLKDLAGETDSWLVVTYQATIENPDWVNDEKNVLTAFNTSECKGLQRPCTHLISLNQSKKSIEKALCDSMPTSSVSAKRESLSELLLTMSMRCSMTEYALLIFPKSLNYFEVDESSVKTGLHE